MPWTARDAHSHCHAADTPHLRNLWKEVANNALEEYDGDEGRAIRAANAAVNREKKKSGEGSSMEEKSNKLIRDLQTLTDRF